MTLISKVWLPMEPGDIGGQDPAFCIYHLWYRMKHGDHRRDKGRHGPLAALLPMRSKF